MGDCYTGVITCVGFPLGAFVPMLGRLITANPTPAWCLNRGSIQLRVQYSWKGYP
jgi:hypothetical protein